MRKQFFLLSLALASLILSSCVINPFESGGSSDDSEYEILDFYAVNDFHGATENSYEKEEPGLNRIAYQFDYLESLNPDGTVFLSSGDMWQGSADSNLTRGELVTEAMNLIGFSSMTIGNHEFDWGKEFILKNKEIADFPFLACNIVDKVSDEPIYELADPYTVIEKKGIKIGIIGSIGEGLTSSILGSNVQGLKFAEPTPYVLDACKTLRDDENVDFVVYSTHNGSSSVSSEIAAEVDAIFLGHEHRYESGNIGGTPYLQGKSNGRYISHMSFKVDKNNDEIELLKSENLDTYFSESAKELTEMKSLYDGYLTELNAVKNEELGYLSQDRGRDELSMLQLKAIHDYAKEIDQEIVQVITNGTGGVRSDLLSGTVTYGDVYQTFPFDNIVAIAEITYENYSKLQKAYGKYPDYLDASPGETFKVAVLDYVAENVGDSFDNSLLWATYDKETLGMYPRDIIRKVFLKTTSNGDNLDVLF